MRPRSLRGLAWEPVVGRVTIALVGMDGKELPCLPQALLLLDTPRVIAYTKPQLFLANPPAGWIDMLILSHVQQAESVTRLLAWARRRWPGTIQAVVTSHDDGKVECAARQQGAMVFCSSIHEDDWRGLFIGVKQLHTARTGGTV